MDELTSDAPQRATLSVTPAPETVPLAVRLGSDSLRQRLEFSMRAAPPKPLDDGGWVGLAAGVLLYLGFREAEKPLTVQLQFNPTLDLTPSAAENAMATTTMLEFLTHPLRIESPLVAGEAELDLRPLAEAELIDGVRLLHDAYSAIIEIEARTNTRLYLPEALGSDAATASLNLAELLRSRRTTGHSRLKTTLHVAATQAAGLAMRLAETRQVVVPFEQDLLGSTIRFGHARLTFEHLTTTALAPDDSGRAQIRLEAEGQVDVQLIDEPLPSDVAMDPSTGRWWSAILHQA